MSITHGKGFIFRKKDIVFPSYNNHLGKNGIGFLRITARKRDLPNKPRDQNRPIIPIRVSNTVLARAAVAVLALGFIDAGYSGDWSRVEVISAETEESLKAAAVLVVPMCLFLAFSFYEESDA